MVRSKSVFRAGGANEALTMSVKNKLDLKCRSALSTRSISSHSIYCLIHNTEEEQKLIILCIISFLFFFSRKKP